MSIAKADIFASGPVDGMGTPDYRGSYVLISIQADDGAAHKFRVSFGGADQLRAELVALLQLMAGRTAIETETLEAALEELVKLQAHYALLLNEWDGGRRIAFKSAAEWLARLDEIRPVNLRTESC